MASSQKRSALALSFDPVPFKKLRHVTADGAEEAYREPTRDGQLSALLARLPFQANGGAPPCGPGAAAAGAPEAGGGHQWMAELAEQLAAAQEELNIMLDVINQVEAGTLVTVENVQRPKPTLAEHKDDVAKRVGVKQAATQAAHARLEAVAQRITTRVDADHAFYDGLRRLQADWRVKRVVSHGRVRFFVDLALPPPSRAGAAPSSRLRSTLPEREQAAAQVELTRGKGGHLAAVREAHRPQWELQVAVHEQGSRSERGSEPVGAKDGEGEDTGMADVGGRVEAVARDVILDAGRGGEAGPSEAGDISGVHALLRRLQASLFAETVFDACLGEAVAHPFPGALVVRASSSQLEISLAHGQRLGLFLKRAGGAGGLAENRERDGKAAEARAFLMEHYMEERYGGQKRGGSEAVKEGGSLAKRHRRGGEHVGSASAEGGLAVLCRALQQEHAWSIIQRQVQHAVRAIPGASTTACVPSLFRSQPAGWWLAVHVAGRELVTVLDDGARCQIRGQAAPHHGDINAAYITAYVQDEIARYQIRRAIEAASQRGLAAEIRGLLTAVFVAALDDEQERPGWAALHRSVSPESSAGTDADVDSAELWVTASPGAAGGGTRWQLTYKSQRTGWRGKREGPQGRDVRLELLRSMSGEGRLGDFLVWLSSMIADGGC